MSNNLNIQLQLETILNAIKSGDTGILAEIIKKLLLADYEIYEGLNQIGKQIADQGKIIKELQESKLIDDLLRDLSTGDIKQDANVSK